MFDSKIILVIIIAIIFHLIYINKQFEYETYNTDITSAIRRARTPACKKQIKEFANKFANSDSFPSILKRNCKLDSNVDRIQKLGCVQNSTEGLIEVEEQFANNSTRCLELCFSYGHSFAGFAIATNTCFCGDVNLISDSRNAYCKNHWDIQLFQVDKGIYNHKANLIANDETFQRTGQKIRIAFLLALNGKSSLQIHRLLRNIYSERHIYYLHVDLRDDHLYGDLLYLENVYKNIFLAKTRFSTIWGGPALLTMMLHSMSNLLRYDWDYLINLSPTDFPIKPLVELEHYLESIRRGSIFLKSHNMKGYNFIKKQGLDLNFYQCEDRVWKLNQRKLPAGIVYTGGSDWLALPKDFCSFILDNLKKPTSLVYPLTELYNYTLLPAESYFHTLALNSEFCDRVMDTNLRLTNWKRKGRCKCQHRDVVDWCGCSPSVYRPSDWSKLQETNKTNHKLFFSRKFDPTVSLSIINQVEENLLMRIHDKTERINMKSYWQNIFYSNLKEESFLKQFGMYAINGLNNDFKISKILDIHNSKLTSIHEYYEVDDFVGLIFQYKDELSSVELLIERNASTSTKVSSQHRFQSKGRQLQVIEVNHNFDSNEKMFRNKLPLNKNSDLIVFHEWILESSINETGSYSFLLLDPKGYTQLEQKVKIKTSTKRTRHSLAHRLRIEKPMMSGLWTLRVSSQDKQDKDAYLEHKFLVFDERIFEEQIIDQQTFNKFYFVSSKCVNERKESVAITESLIDNCLTKSWSLSNQKLYKM